MASAYLQRTLTSGNQKTFTISFWVKRSTLGTGTMISYAQTPGNTSHARGYMNFASDSLHFAFNPTGSSWWSYNVSNRFFRDISAWYHLVARVDTTDASASNRLKIYVNGEQQTLNSTIGTQNLDTGWNNNSYTLRVGEYAGDGGENFDGQFAHFHYIDGTAYDASTFGETDATTGIWKPKVSPSVTYGTNGFFLKFDNSANMGLDSGGGSNNLTTSGTIIQNKDTPSNVFATLNPLARRLTNNAPTYLNTNSSLQAQTADGQNNNAIATLGDLAKGKYYFECKVGTVGDDFGVGISDTPDPANGIPVGSHEIFYKNDGTKWNGSAYASYGATYTTGDIIGCAFDVTAGTVQFYKNGVSQGTAATDLATNLNKGYTPMGYTNKGLMHYNFGSGYFGTTAVSSAQNPTDGVGIFEYTPPTNYRAVCTRSLNAQEYS